MTKFYAWVVDLVNDRYPPYHWIVTIPVGAMVAFLLLVASGTIFFDLIEPWL
jgi:hypothetical protein